MQSHLETRAQDLEIEARSNKVAEFVVAEFTELSVEKDLVLNILGILDVNSFEIPSTEATVQVSISPTFYVRLFCTKVSCKAFLYLHFRFKLLGARILTQMRS